MNDLTDQYNQRYKSILLPIAGRLEKYLKECLADEIRIDRISVRAKSVEKFIRKAGKMTEGHKKYNDPLNQIQDQIGARIVTYYTDDIERIRILVEKYLHPIESITIVPDSESEFGYFGHHYIMLLPREVFESEDDKPLPFFELQIKTLFQHAWSEANHDLGYKPETDLSICDKRKIAFTSAQAWGADLIFNELYNRFKSV